MNRFNRGFTLVELVVAVAVLTLLVVLVTSLVNSVATITTLGNKRLDADSQARQLLDRMALDFTQMVKRPDLDYYRKSSANLQTGGNDQIAFYSMVSGYHPSTSAIRHRSPVSLVAYRVNLQNRLERMAKGLKWNGATSDAGVVFLPLTIAATWPFATDSTVDEAYAEIGPEVFRLEYHYLLTNGALSVTPATMQDVAAVVVDIAVVDPKSRVLLSDTTTPPQIGQLAQRLVDYAAGLAPGELLSTWQTALDNTTDMPRPAVSAVRLYERVFYLSPPTS